MALAEGGDRGEDNRPHPAEEPALVGRALLAALCLLPALSGPGVPAAAEEARGSGTKTRPAYEWRLPTGFPAPAVPAGNPMSAAGAELGRRLFYDTRLSDNGTQACASCHRQRLAFTDGRARAVGSTGQVHPRGSMTLTNVAYNAAFTWEDPARLSLEDQAEVPLFGERPVELGLAGREEKLLVRLRSDPLYATLFREAFPDEPDPIRIANVIRALACFERTLLSGDSPYDRLVFQGRMDALSDAAWRGMRLFFSDRLGCSRCHGGINFSGPITFAGREDPAEPLYANTGLYDEDGRGAYPATDTGLNAFTRRRKDMGRFKAPTLRNIALTAPYMHDGSIRTLEEAIDHYAAGGRAGARSRYRSPLVRGFAISGEEKRDLIAFLHALTDETFVTDPRFADPWAPAASEDSSAVPPP